MKPRSKSLIFFVILLIPTAPSLLGQGVTKDNGGSARLSLATIEQIARSLATGAPPRDRVLNIFDYYSRVDPNPLAALGWLAFGMKSGNQRATEVFNREKAGLAHKINGTLPESLRKDLDVILSGKFAPKEAVRIGNHLKKSDSSSSAIAALGWFLFATVLGDLDASKEVDKYFDQQKE